MVRVFMILIVNKTFIIFIIRDPRHMSVRLTRAAILSKKVEGFPIRVHVASLLPLLHPFSLFHVSDSRKPIEKPSEPVARQISNVTASVEKHGRDPLVRLIK